MLDVCHNIDGFRAVFAQINQRLPAITSVRVVLGMSKTKKMDSLVNFFENEALIKDVRIVSRPHMRLYKIEEAYKAIKQIGCTKLSDLINETLAEGDTSDSSRVSESAHQNNIH